MLDELEVRKALITIIKKPVLSDYDAGFIAGLKLVLNNENLKPSFKTGDSDSISDLLQIKHRLKLSYFDFALDIGISATALRNFINKQNVSTKTENKIKEYLGKSRAQLKNN